MIGGEYWRRKRALDARIQNRIRAIISIVAGVGVNATADGVAVADVARVKVAPVLWAGTTEALRAHADEIKG